MRLVFASLAFAAAVLFSLGAQAQFQPVILMCGDPPAPCSATNPVPTTPGTSTTQDVNLTKVGGAAVALGQAAMAASIPVAIASNQTAVPVTSGPSSSATAAVAYVSSTALVANQVIKASAGNLYSFDIAADSTLSAAAWWIMIYDATSAPVDGAVTPAKCYPMPAGTTGYAAAFFTPLRLGTGITIGVSTNGCYTKAASTHAFISGDAQ